MAVNKIRMDDIPDPRRNRHSELYDTQEWLTTVADLKKGLKPNEALQVIFTEKTRKKLKHAPRLFKILLDNWMKQNKLEYSIFQRGKDEDGVPILYITNPDKRFT